MVAVEARENKVVLYRSDGQGTMPVLDVVAAAKSLEVGVVEFDDYAGDIFEGVAESLAFLQNNAAQDVKA